MAAWTRAGLLAGAAGAAAVLTVPSFAAGSSPTAGRPAITVTSAPSISVTKAPSTATSALSQSTAPRSPQVSTGSSAAAAAPAGGSASATPSPGTNTPQTNSHKTGGTGSIQCNDGTVYWTPNDVWPPNHKMQTVTIWYVDNENDGDSTMISVGTISDNETVGGMELNGSGQPTAQQGPDWSGTGNMGSGSDTGGGADSTAPGSNDAQTTAQVRAERSGTDPAGRTYDIQVTCTDNGASGDPNDMTGAMNSRMQTVDLLVKVPHDQGQG